MKQSVAWALAVCGVAAAPSVGAVTLTVGPGRMYPTATAASAAAHDGDVVEIAAGTYHDITTWRASRLTIRSVGGRAHFDAAGVTISNGKAIWVIAGSNTTVEGIEFSGARVPDRNGAGIRQEGPGLTLRDCYFHDNEDGVLTGADATSDVVFENTEFHHNGAGDGQSHNLYIGVVRSFTMRGCYSHDAVIGHLVKSRALANYLLYNRITGERTDDSYEIDLPQGGLAVLVGNVIEQGAASSNGTILTFNEESTHNPVQALYLANNTFVNDRSGGIFVSMHGAATTSFDNNLFVGPGTRVSGTVTESHDLAGTAAWFVDAAHFDYHLTAMAGAINAGAPLPATPSGSAVGLTPMFEYRHPLATTARSVVGAAIDVGAYEYGAVTSVDAGVSDAGVDVPVVRDTGVDVVARDVVDVVVARDVVDVTVARDVTTARDVVDAAPPHDLGDDGSAPDDVADEAAEPPSDVFALVDVASGDAAPDTATPADASIADDAETDDVALTPDASTGATTASGCGCRTAHTPRAPGHLALAMVGAVLAARRRRRS